MLEYTDHMHILVGLPNMRRRQESAVMMIVTGLCANISCL
jgi:hypothetical protein